MKKYYILMCSGECIAVNAKDKPTAFSIAAESLGYHDGIFEDDGEDGFDDFMENLNMCEWKDDEFRIIENYKLDGSDRCQYFPADTPYDLEVFTNLHLDR